MIDQIKENMPPLEMIDLLKDLTNKIESERDLHPKNYLEKDVQLLYNLAHKYYSINNYLDAEALFIRLVLARPLEKNYWQGLASSRQMQKNYSGALAAWGMCALIDNKDLSFHLYGAECLYHLEELDKAEAALTHVGNNISKDDKYFSKYEKIQQMLKGDNEDGK